MIRSVIVKGLIAMTILGSMAGADRKSALEVVSAVDLSRYTGRWYEIARLPNRFTHKLVRPLTSIVGSDVRLEGL